MITLIGFGNIGRTLTALIMANSKEPIHFNIMEVSQKIGGTLLDVEHALELYPQHTWSLNDQDKMNHSDFIIHTAGAIVPPGKTRRDASEISIAITEEVFSNYTPITIPFIIVVANPVDIIAYVTQKLTALPPERVFGTGTFLDSIRMNHYLKPHLPIGADINSVLLGEHGSAIFMSQQLSKANDKHLHKLLTEDELDACMEEVKNAANLIKQTQGATIYGVSHILYQLYSALKAEEVQHLPLSTLIPRSYLQDPSITSIYLSTYCEINKEGVIPCTHYHPDPIEAAKFHHTIQELIALIPQKYLES
ncbi:L-lactate dehydrogenase [Lishizhenia tianjinensis]|uniref:L-lactate dehydrogenase n=1 Tax=Lishizhenia tianjinensis TaxID=477690 RepID=A0A1I6XYJ9_9FLAO|nr:hypothetical protein [Lishizhenia tianjinensis]SFT43455.1 L-lactate dehydrogenase [Lishizhenia tianjinensis]